MVGEAEWESSWKLRHWQMSFGQKHFLVIVKGCCVGCQWLAVDFLQSEKGHAAHASRKTLLPWLALASSELL
jgi:hypothetical protein